MSSLKMCSKPAGPRVSERAFSPPFPSHAVLAPSGLASITDILSVFLRPCEHLLMTDSCYGPTRKFCLNTLAPRGIDTTFYDPLAGAGIARSLRENTRLVFMESPGSATF